MKVLGASVRYGNLLQSLRAFQRTHYMHVPISTEKSRPAFVCVGAADDCIPLGAGGWEKCPQPRNPQRPTHKSSSATAATLLLVLKSISAHGRMGWPLAASLSLSLSAILPRATPPTLEEHGHHITACLPFSFYTGRPFSGMRFNAEKGGNGLSTYRWLGCETTRDRERKISRVR
jgi:hypothetical protein